MHPGQRGLLTPAPAFNSRPCSEQPSEPAGGLRHSGAPVAQKLNRPPHPVWEGLPDLSRLRRLGKIAAEQPQQAGWYNLYQALREEPVLCETGDFQIIPLRVAIGARSRTRDALFPQPDSKEGASAMCMDGWLDARPEVGAWFPRFIIGSTACDAR